MNVLENWYQFTDDECRQIGEWKEQFNAEQDELNQKAYRRLEFASWLVEHNILNEFTITDTTADA
ncbi:MAG TPA: hypothetical protein VGN15_11885 [Ktedonobacteraceae bacterium]|jgi:hypothetical protein|nr:hypothetical protein [Ktedonobacteraceae bacterium]